MDRTVDKLTAQIEGERERVLEMLDRLRDALVKDHFDVRADRTRLTLHPANRMELGLEARQRDDHESLELKLRWPTRPTPALEIRPRATAPGRTGSRVDVGKATSPLLESTPRDELYEMARTVELDGRSTMSADELRDGLAPHASQPELWTHAALYERASERAIPGRSRMSKEELLAALLEDESAPTA